MDVRKLAIVALLVLTSVSAGAQRVLSLEECRQMALQSSRELQQSTIKEQMARYDHGTARANFFPKISATGIYNYNNKDIALISDETGAKLSAMGTAAQSGINDISTAFMTQVMGNKKAVGEYMNSEMWKIFKNTLSSVDLSAKLNEIGTQINDALHLDIKNVYVGAVTVEQPVFVGGKIIAANKMASLAEDLSKAQYDTEYDKTIIETDNAYWQIVSIAAKRNLAQTYSDLLQQMLTDAGIAVEAGTATESDLLSIKVKANEAQLMLTKATNGLILSKMLLCKHIGLPLDTEILLKDENCEDIASPASERVGYTPLEDVIARRSELRSLDLASQIYDQKVKIARADYLPQLGVMASYLVSNPNANNGISNTYGGRFTAGAVLKIPIFHGLEGAQKIKKAQAEANLMKNRYEDACEKISLQVSQQRFRYEEALQRAKSTAECLDSAEENLRAAMVGFEAGVVASSTTLAAQAAWLQAHSEYIDAGIELKMAQSSLLAAQGELKNQ